MHVAPDESTVALEFSSEELTDVSFAAYLAETIHCIVNMTISLWFFSIHRKSNEEALITEHFSLVILSSSTAVLYNLSFIS